MEKAPSLIILSDDIGCLQVESRTGTTESIEGRGINGVEHRQTSILFLSLAGAFL